MLTLLAPLLAMNLLSYIPWAAIFLFTQAFGVRLYYLKRREECLRVQRHIQSWCSHTTDGGKGYGYSFGYWYAVSVNIVTNECGGDYSVFMIATESSYKALTKDAEDDFKPLIEVPKTDKTIAVYERSGSYANTWFRQRDRDAIDVPKEPQKPIVEAIIANHKKCRHTVVYLHGPPRTGKSMIGILVANEFGGSFCNTLKPWQPGDSLGSLHSEVEPKFNKPLVLVFDEFDSALNKIHTGIAPHPKIPTAVLDKPGWNHMLDEIQRGMYHDLILIITSNKGPDYIRSLDPSYIREGRIDMTFEMTELL
jgi:hypothetical protein